MIDSTESRISTNQFVDASLVDEICEDFRASGVRLEPSEEKTPEAYNFAEIIIPTAIIIYFVGPFVKEISASLAKDSYKAVKSLFKKTLGKDRSVKYEIRRADGELVPPTFSRELSFLFKFDEGFSIIFLIHSGASQEQALESFSKAMVYVAKLADDRKMLSETKDFFSEQIGFFGTAYLIFQDDRLCFLDWPSTSQQSSIQAFALPSA